MRRALVPSLCLLFTSLTGVASAQPMIDPSRMSGIPRPDPQVPPGELTVRVLRGDFAHPLVGEMVHLEGDGGPYDAKVDETDHAVFKDLHLGSTYTATSTAFAVTLTSQPITMPESSGVKLMLVFPKDDAADLGAPDGKARPDARLAAGTIAVKLVDGDDKPLAGVVVVLARATQASKIIDEQKQPTGADGTIRFQVPVTADAPAAYAVKALRADATVASEPFKLGADHGVLIGLRSVPLSHDAGALNIADNSHFLIEVRDEDVQVLENLIIDNSTGAPFDPGPAGLKLPLPEGAEGAQVAGDEGAPPPPFAVEGTDVVLKGRLPTGTTNLRIGFLLPIHGDSVTLRQKTPIPFINQKYVTDRFEEMTVDGTDLSKEDRTMAGGRMFWLVSGPGTKAGGELNVHLGGLPHASTLWRYVATGVALFILLWGVIGVLRPRSDARARTPRERLILESRRIQLLNQIAAAQGAAAQREKLVAELEQIYRQLDEDAA